MFSDLTQRNDASPTWTEVRLKHWVIINGKTLGEGTLEDLEFDYIDIGAVGKGQLNEVPTSTRFGDSPSRARRIVLPGDTLVSTVRTYLGATAHMRDTPRPTVCSTGFATMTPKADTVPAFVGFAVRGNRFAEALTRQSVGIAYPAISEQQFARIRISVPPLDEQSAIVTYLHHANSRIDRAIRAKRKLVDLLDERRLVVNTQAVTHGLNPRATSMDSGIPWLGRVPASWQIWPIGRLARVGNGSTPSRTTPSYWHRGDYPWLNSSVANKRTVDTADQFVTRKALTECHLPIVRPGSLIVAITGQGKTRGKAALLGIEATINQHLAYVAPDARRINARFLQAVLDAAYAELRRLSDDSGSTKGALTCQDLKAFKVPVPSLDEQSMIVRQIDAELKVTDDAVCRAQREIELLREFQIRLTSDVVTGQLDVRSAAARLPDLDPESLAADVAGSAEDTLDSEAADLLEDVDA